MICRIKFEIDELVNEMLDKLPERVWISDSTTFLDPAIGGGQFVREIEKRLRNYGHSDDNIKQRVFGYESNKLNVNYAVNKYKLIGTYKVANKLDVDFIGMKFDVVVGNPPYQETDNSGNRKDKAKNLWTKFIEMAYYSSTDDGLIGIICPNSWLSPSADIGKGKTGVRFLKDYFSKGSLFDVNVKRLNKYFPNVGVEISYFLFSKKKLNIPCRLSTLDNKNNIIQTNIDLTSVNFLPRDLNPLSISITNKLLHNSLEKFNFSTTNSKLSITDWKTDNSLPVKVFHSCSKSGIKYTDNISHPLLSNKKVIISASSVYAPFYDEGNYLFSNMTMAYVLENNEKLENVKSILSSKLYILVNELNIWGGWVSYETIRNLPKLNTNKKWTDREIYEEFNLTKEEIDFVESYIFIENKHPKLK